MLQKRATWIRGAHRAGDRKDCRCGDARHGSAAQERRRARRREDRTWRRENGE
jgi:hypothetical protein